MPTETPDDRPPIDEGLLSPVSVGEDAAVSDSAVLDALVTVEVGLARAFATIAEGDEGEHAAAAISTIFGWTGTGRPCRGHGISVREVAEASVSGGNPVIPLVAILRDRTPESARTWVHRGATSQDILDSALMVVARNAVDGILESLSATEDALARFAAAERDRVAAARTLTQHAVPTTVGLRAANWLRATRRAASVLSDARRALPAQLGGAAGTLAAFVEHAHALAGADAEKAVAALPAAFAAELGLAAPEAPWHTTRWPVTELGDAIVQSIDAMGLIATDVATLSRTEIGEISEGASGGSSAMPQKQNPAESVLIRSAALRAPQLGATLHLAATLAVDERPDGAWHAEWPTLRELLRLALGSAAHGASLARGLKVDGDAVSRNLGLTRGLIVAERLSIALTPLVGADRVKDLIARVRQGGDVAELVRTLPEAASLDVDALLDPARYTGLAARLVDDALEDDR